MDVPVAFDLADTGLIHRVVTSGTILCAHQRVPMFP